MKNKIFSFIAIITLILTSSCSNDEETDKPDDLQSWTFEVAFPSQKKELIELSSGIYVQKTNDGKIIWQGDILLTNEQVELLSTADTNLKSGILSYIRRKWTDGIIPYTFEPTITEQARLNITQAIEHWELRTPIQFLFLENGASAGQSHVEFISGSGNWSMLGRVGGKQQLCIDKESGTVGNAIHEIGHAVGLIHEQCRKDRDEYIQVNYNNIRPEWRSQFDKEVNAHYVADGGFDFNSVMLYSSFYNSNVVYNTETPAMTGRDGSTWHGQRDSLSGHDIRGVAHIYGF